MKLPEKYFFGWSNFKYYFRELIKVGSSKPSFFSKKRLESGIAFFTLIWGMIYWLVKKYELMTTTDFLIWSGILLAICGYTMNKIEELKKNNIDELPKE